MDELMKTMLDSIATQAGGGELDAIGGMYAVCRMPGESDAVLRARLINYMTMKRPHPMQMKLFYLLAKLGLQSTRDYLMAGVLR